MKARPGPSLTLHRILIIPIILIILISLLVRAFGPLPSCACPWLHMLEYKLLRSLTERNAGFGGAWTWVGVPICWRCTEAWERSRLQGLACTSNPVAAWETLNLKQLCLVYAVTNDCEGMGTGTGRHRAMAG